MEWLASKEALSVLTTSYPEILIQHLCSRNILEITLYVYNDE